MDEDLVHAIDIAKIAVGRGRIRNYPGSGGIWYPHNDGFPDATFVDWGLARAVAEILNAIADGRLVRAALNPPPTD